MSKRISVIIPVFNASATLNLCLQSLSKQSFRNFEVVLVNDGSTDDSAEVITRWKEQQKDVSVTLIQQENRGLGAARNAAIESAGGEILALLDADDYWEASKLEQVHIWFRDHQELNWMYHPVWSFGLKVRKTRACYLVKNLQDLLETGNPIVPSAACFRSELLKPIGFSTNKKFHGAEDLYLWIQLISSKEYPGYLPLRLAQYREDGGMSSRVDEHLAHIFAVLEHYQAKGIFSSKSMESAKKRKYLEAARFYQKRGQFSHARRYYGQSGKPNGKVKLLRMLNKLNIPV